MTEVRRPFDAVTRWMHWLTLAIVLALFATAYLADKAQDDESANLLITIHRSLGVTIWALTLFRLFWRNKFAYVPTLPAAMRTAHRVGVKLSEFALYGALMLQPLTGLGASLLYGKSFDLFLFQVPALLVRNRSLDDLFAALHEIGAITLAVLAGLHASAALFHYLVFRDDILSTMLPGLRPNGAAGHLEIEIDQTESYAGDRE